MGPSSSPVSPRLWTPPLSPLISPSSPAFPSAALGPWVPPILGAEAALGTALVLGAWPAWTLPTALALVLAFVTVSLRALIRGELDECGCYGGLIRLTVPWSLALDVVYILLLAIAWTAAPRFPAGEAAWKLTACLGAGALAWALAVASWASLRRRGRPLVIWSPIREGSLWNPRWLGSSRGSDLRKGEHLAAFLSLDCSRCNAWMSLLSRVVHPHPALPAVLGVFDLPEEKREDLEELLGFPLLTLGPLALRRLAWTMPFGALIVEGQVRDVWADTIPETFLDRLRALQTTAPLSVIEPSAEESSRETRAVEPRASR